jgi:outer membrane protein assembly factor BamE
MPARSLMPRFVAPMPLAAAALLAGAAFTSGCASLQSSDSLLGVITPYKVEIVQGNVVTKDQVDLVKPGMTRPQVRDLLGSPLLTDIFHADRWDYVFTIKRQGAPEQMRRVVVHFDGDRLASIDAPSDLPSEREFDASITRKSDIAKGAPPALELTAEQRAALPAPKAPAGAASSADEPVGPDHPYPPLEAAP